MRAKEIMSAPVVTASPWSTLKTIAELMLSHRIGAVPIVDMEDHLLGVVSEADVISLQSQEDPRLHITHQPLTTQPHTWTASQVMSTDVVTAERTDDVTTIARSMLARRARHVIVVGDGCVVGIISRRDILRAIARTDESIRRELTETLERLAPLIGHYEVGVIDGSVTLSGSGDARSRELAGTVARCVAGVLEVCFAERAAVK